LASVAYLGQCLDAQAQTRTSGFDLIQKVIDKGEKNPAAGALGNPGGRKGGPTRAANLTAKRRSEIAKKAPRRAGRAIHSRRNILERLSESNREIAPLPCPR
jgi:hypothetical protein